MRVNFPNTSVIDASAERLRKHLKKSVSRDQARNIVSQCYGYNNYVHLQRSLSEAPPRLDTLSQDQILSLRLYQLNTLTAVLHLRQNSAEEVWMAMSPNIELAGPQRLLLGQIGRYTFEWGQPDESR